MNYFSHYPDLISLVGIRWNKTFILSNLSPQTLIFRIKTKNLWQQVLFTLHIIQGQNQRNPQTTLYCLKTPSASNEHRE
jgi:hypothetical protein